MRKVNLLAKRNEDGSYSVSYESGALVKDALVDFYNEQTGTGYQRNETLRSTRGRQIESYIRRCVDEQMSPRLFELTANARVEQEDWTYEPLDDTENFGFLTITVPDDAKWLYLIDGGTRLLGIENALNARIIDQKTTFDVRIFVGLNIGEEIAQFLLINEKQKRVRTDLSLRVVQRLLDDGKLEDKEIKVLQTVVPDTDAWRFEASRIASMMNADPDSPWANRIQMPGDSARPVTLQAFFTSLKPLLDDLDITTKLGHMEETGDLQVNGQRVNKTKFLVQVLKNFWRAVASVNPDADREPETAVLWAPIGVNSCHSALTPILNSIFDSADRTLTVARFEAMVKESQITNYPYWFTKKGAVYASEHYPGQKGEATLMTGAANYKRLAGMLEKEWRATLHALPSHAPAVA